MKVSTGNESYEERRTLTRCPRMMTMQPRNSPRSWCVVSEDSVESTDDPV
jgi:hypothetical protein